MKRHLKGKLVIFGLLIALIGVAAGFAISAMMTGDLQGDFSAPQAQSATEKYKLGQNAFDKPVTPKKADRNTQKAMTNPNVRYKNGARVLVPGEPALKEVRMTLENGYDYAADPESEYTDPGDFGDVQDGHFLDGGVKAPTSSNPADQDHANTGQTVITQQDD